MSIMARRPVSGRLVFAVLGLAILVCSCKKAELSVIPVPEDSISGPLGLALDGYFTGITPFGFSGTVLVAKDGEVLINKGYGFAVDSGAVPNTAATVLSCGSVTKQFTAAAIMKLQMQGKLATSDSLLTFFDEVPPDKRGITLRQLLSHTAGLVDYTGEDYQPTERDEAVRIALGAPLRFFPGTDYAYSNAGYSVLAAVVERVSGQSYEDYLYEELFAPAGMAHTGYRRPKWDGAVVAHWYTEVQDNGTPLEKPYPYWNLLGNGDMLSTTADMYRWHLALARGDILDSAASAEMYSPVVDDYGYGWRVMDTPLGRLAGHGGASDLGSSCQFWRSLDTTLAVIVFCNRDYDGEPLAGTISEKLRGMLAGESVEVPPSVGGEVVIEPRSIAGMYRLESGAELSVSSAHQSVVLSGSDQQVVDLLCFPQVIPPDSHITLNRISADAANAALKGEWEPLAKLLSDRERRFPRIKAFIEAMTSSKAVNAGSVISARAVGTFPSNYRAGLIETVIEVSFEKGSSLYRFIWDSNRIVGVGLAGGARSLRVTFLPVSPERLVGYHLGIGKVVEAELRWGADGGVDGLIFDGDGKPVVASRIQ